MSLRARFLKSYLYLSGLVIACLLAGAAQAGERVIFEQEHFGSLAEFDVSRELKLQGTYEIQVDFVGGTSRGGKVELEIAVDGKDIEDLVTRNSIKNIRRRVKVASDLKFEFEAVGAPVDRFRLVEIQAGASGS